jgi:site-specific DNA recombinase
VAAEAKRLRPMVAPSPAMVRCAIYTRKSTEEGLEQSFNRLDAQRESAEAYVLSQKNEGWIALEERYDDGGFTRANMERPALKRLLADVEAEKVDCIIVYKYDRLSRSLADFMKLLEILDRHHVTFVAVTQPFDTRTSAGRFLVHLLLNFAQFEREMIAERTRDKMRAARRKGEVDRRLSDLGLRRSAPKRSAARQSSRGRAGSRDLRAVSPAWRAHCRLE